MLSLSMIFIIPFINAQSSFDFDFAASQITRGIESVLGILSPIFETIIGEYQTSDFFFHKILLLILLIIIVKNVLDRTPIGEKNKKISTIVSLIVSILAIRFINQNNFFESIFIQYGVLGIAITTILPIVIFFYFIHNTKIGSYGRKVFWTFYFVILTVIWIMKSSEIPEMAHWIYGITVLAAIIFIFFDKKIHSYFGMVDFFKFEEEKKLRFRRKFKRLLLELKKDLEDSIITPEEYNKSAELIKKKLKALYS